MQIARGLSELRERAQLTQEEVAKRAGLSAGTVNRYENWSTTARLKPSTVKLLAGACGATAAEVETLVQLAGDASAGWWVGNDAVPSWLNPLVSLEHEAAYENVFAPSVVPGLLQTRSYAMAIHQAQEVREDPAEIERMVDARIQRQGILDRRPPFHLWAVLDEAVLRRIVGDAAVMAEQIDHLRDMADRPNVDIQVLPFSAGAHAAVLGQFVTLGTDELSAVYVEMRGGGMYLDKRPDVERYRLAWDYVRSQAANTSASLAMLTAALKEYRS
ncbi:MAG: helix-turn-helix transcriptional regulator [Streptomycetaceae bacterium]|nr:helix-turn-helix transcriptional regulator [Streptomycetaceae bacterium]